MLFSAHILTDRANRLRRLEEVLGFTHVALEWVDEANSKRYCLTSSGVMIIKALHEDFVITAWMATVDQLYRMCLMMGKAQMPPKLYKRVSKNMERHRDLLEA